MQKLSAVQGPGYGPSFRFLWDWGSGQPWFVSRLAKHREQVWESLHVSPQTAPSKGAKLCADHHWFGRPSNLRFEPYYELPMGISKLWALVQFRFGSHTLPIEQGRFARPAVPRHLRRCTVCHTQAEGDELHCVYDMNCPHFSDIRAQFPGLFQDAAGCMCVFMWHRDQKSVCHCLIAEGLDMNTIPSS